jgi:hypothetical protein
VLEAAAIVRAAAADKKAYAGPPQP